MTPREPDRFEAKARKVCGFCTHRANGLAACPPCVAAALRREANETLGGVRQYVEAMPVCTRVGVLRLLDDLRSPAAAPAAETGKDEAWGKPAEDAKDPRSATFANRSEGADFGPDPAQPSEPVAPAPDLLELFEQALALLESAQEAVGWRLQERIAEFLQRSRTASPVAQGKEPRK